MAKLNRLTAKIFGETASTTNTPKEIGQFGSAKAGTYNATGDVSTIQSLPAWSNGWIDAVTPTDQFPPLPEMTGVHKVLSYQNAYLLQQGIPEWDSATTYYENGFCAYNGIIYRSILDENINNQPDENPGAWFEYGSGDYANQDINNLTTLGNARLQYAPFSINAGTVINGNNHTLQSGSFIQSYTEAGSYTIEITEAGNYEIEMYGAGGGWARGGYPVSGHYDNTIATGGSGAGFKGILNLPVGSYSLTVGAGGVYVDGGRGTTGGSTNFNDIISANGATGGYTIYGGVNQSVREGGVGGTLQIIDNSYIVSTSKQVNGRNGNSTAVTDALAYMSGATSVYDDTITGYGAGGGSSHEAVNGYFKITKLTGDASKIFCDPCTITTCDGRTKVFNTASSIDILLNTEYKKYNFVETGTLTKNKSIISGFSSANYISTPEIPSFINPWEMVFKVHTSATVNTEQIIYGGSKGSSGSHAGINFGIKNSKWYLYLTYSDYEYSGSSTIQANTDYVVKVEWTGNQYNLYASIDNGQTYILEISNSGTTAQTGNTVSRIGVYGNALQYPWSGSIDLSGSYIKLNGQLWWQGIVDGTSSDYDYASVDGNNKVFKDFETGELLLTNDFKISSTNPSADYWLDTSTIPANLRVNGEINNDLVYIGDCTVLNGGVTAIVNRYFNDSGYLIEKHFPTQPFMPDYASGITIPASTDWNCPSDGIVVCERDIYINGTRIYIFSSYSGYNTPNSMTALISKNEVVRCSSSAMFYPMKGAN